jgi:hypothetical protein
MSLELSKKTVSHLPPAGRSAQTEGQREGALMLYSVHHTETMRRIVY